MKMLKRLLNIIKRLSFWLIKKTLSLFLFMICGIALHKLIAEVLMEPTKDIITLTNIGFAMFIGLASVLFSWSRSLDDKKFSKQINELNRIAVVSIIGSLFFIFSSLFKYIVLRAEDEKNLDNVTFYEIIILYIASYLCVFGVMGAIIMVVTHSFLIFKELWGTLYNEPFKATKELKQDRCTEI